jgi:hypothetical protein
MQRQFRPYQAMPGGGRASAADNCEAHLRVTAIGTKTSPGSVRFCGCHRPSAVKPGVDAVDTSGRQAGGLMVLPDVSSTNYRDLIIALAARHRLPAVYPRMAPTWQMFFGARPPIEGGVPVATIPH